MIPVYNEELVLSIVLEKIIKLRKNILVIDVGSSDRLLEIEKKFEINILHHSNNLGQSAALQTGFRYIINNNSADYVITFDADGQHNSSAIIYLISTAQAGNYDVILGSRFLKKQLIHNMGILKRIVLRIGIWFTSFSTKLNFTDTHNGLRLFTHEALKKNKPYSKRDGSCFGNIRTNRILEIKILRNSC